MTESPVSWLRGWIACIGVFMVLKIALLALATGSVLAQTLPSAQRLDAGSLVKKGSELLQQAKAAPTGVASQVLLDRPDSNIQIAARAKSGQGEWHHDDADILIGVEGTAKVVTGGTIINGKTTAPGEIRGDGIRGGTVQTFGPGDYIRIEAQTAHQMLLAPGTTVRYMAVKVHTAK